MAVKLSRHMKVVAAPVAWNVKVVASGARALCGNRAVFFLPPGFQEVLQQQFVFHVKVSRLLKVEASGAGAGTH